MALETADSAFFIRGRTASSNAAGTVLPVRRGSFFWKTSTSTTPSEDGAPALPLPPVPPATEETAKRRPSFKLPSNWSISFRRPSFSSGGSGSSSAEGQSVQVAGTPGSEAAAARTPGTPPSRSLLGTLFAEPDTDPATPSSTGTPFVGAFKFDTDNSNGPEPNNNSTAPSSTTRAPTPTADGSSNNKKKALGTSAEMDEAGNVTIDATKVFGRLYQVGGGGKAKKKGAQGRIYIVRCAPGHSIPGITDPDQTFAAKSISRHPNHHPTFPIYSLRCHREHACASSLSHPNVIRTHEMVFDDKRGRYLVIMDLVDGGNLAEWLSVDTERCLKRRVGMWKEAVEGVAHMHEQGFTHRDIKPHNFVLSNGQLKLIDFGTASCSGRGHPKSVLCDTCGPRIISGEGNNEGRYLFCKGVVGTTQYMAPEIFGDNPYDPLPTDIFALGILLFTLLLPQPPWPCSVSSEKNWRQWTSKSILPKEAVEVLERAGVDLQVVGGMIDPDPSKRPGLEWVRGTKWYRSLA